MLLRSSSSPVLSSLSCHLEHPLPPLPVDLPLDIPSHRLPPPVSSLRTSCSPKPPPPLPSDPHPHVERPRSAMRRARSESDLHSFGCAPSDPCPDPGLVASISPAVRSLVLEEETHVPNSPDADFGSVIAPRVAAEAAVESRRLCRIPGPMRSTAVTSNAPIRASFTIDSVAASMPVLANSSGLLQEMGESLNPMCMASGVGICKESDDGFYSNSHGGGSGKGGGGRHKRNDGESFYGDSDTTELYYQKLLQADPQNPLLLRNYAQYLAEAKRDFRKSEEYYERAILFSPNDGEILSKYAKHVWDTHKDQDRAENYFERAVHATPDDCYVLASYASFLWESDDAEAESIAVSHIQHDILGGSPLLIVSV